MTRRTVITALPGGLLSAQSAIEHKLLYKETGRFGGWPANHGIWSWGDEILCGFSAAYFKRMPANRHQYDNQKPEEPRRSEHSTAAGPGRLKRQSHYSRPNREANP